MMLSREPQYLRWRDLDHIISFSGSRQWQHEVSIMKTLSSANSPSVGQHLVAGHVNPGFEAVHGAFVDNFARRHELGGACCAYQSGEKVVDLWGGIRNKRTDEPWEQNTMVIVYSATKGLAAMTLAIAHSRGWLDYEERVCAYWPEFAQNGKERITVRQLLAHHAGF
jgi:CubicO group peptidase (beta-lactamase class C family)